MIGSPSVVRKPRACIAPGCPNAIIRVCTRKDGTTFALCAYHVRRAILYLTPEQIDRLVFPEQKG